MIKTVKISNFKCFIDESILFRDLTILTGTNSSGKSSLIQAILLAGKHSSGSDILEYLETLGDYNDKKNRYTNPAKIEISVYTDDNHNKTKISITATEDLQFLSKSQSPQITYPSNLIYLNANRVSVSSLNHIKVAKEKQFDVNGKYVIGFYETNKNEQVIESLQKKEADSLTLDGQLDYWLKYITGTNLQFDTEKIGTFARAFYRIDKIKDRIKPENLGTGINYLLSILVSCLSAQKGNIIIIENPEIHLHPLAQARVGEFLAFVAANGIQLIIETHNDHIINSICYQQYKNNINEDQVIIQYKNSSDDPFEKIEIRNGKFYNSLNKNRFPQGFFDATLKEIFEING
ncbi:MAG: AAA family ATPase [Bacteroidales bacterium]|nr:AAA family ATPase [Bacteroidales bacterium]